MIRTIDLLFHELLGQEDLPLLVLFKSLAFGKQTIHQKYFQECFCKIQSIDTLFHELLGQEDLSFLVSSKKSSIW